MQGPMFKHRPPKKNKNSIDQITS